MELYRKKVNLGGKPNQDTSYTTSQRPRNIYLQKMIKKNPKQNETFEGSLNRDNLPNVRSSLEDMVSEENNKKKAMKYAGQRNTDVQSPESKQVRRRIEKSASPPRRGGGYSRNYREDSGEATPIRKVLNLSREPYYSAVGQRFNTINNDNKPIVSVKRRSNNIRNIKRKNFRNQYNDGEDDDYYYNQPPNYNVMNPEESQNDYEFSSIQDDDRFANGLKNSRSPQPTRPNKQFGKIERNPRYNEPRTKDIQVMPPIRKPSKSKYLSNDINNNTNINNTNVNNSPEEEMDELLKTIEDLQKIIANQKLENRRLKKDNYNKNKEMNMLKNDYMIYKKN